MDLRRTAVRALSILALSGLTVPVLGACGTTASGPAAEPPRAESTIGTPPPFVKSGGVIVFSLAFAPDGSELTVVTRFMPPTVWDTSTWAKPRRLPGLRMVAYDSAASIVAAAEGRDGLRLRRRGESKPFRTLEGPGITVHFAAFSPDDRLLASAHDDGAVKIWDVETGEQLHTLVPPSATDGAEASTSRRGRGARAVCLAFAADGRRLYSASTSGAIDAWDCTTWKRTRTIAAPGGAVLGLDLSRDGRTLVTSHGSGGVAIWNTATWEVTRQPDYTCAAVSPDGATIALGGDDIALWDVREGKRVWKITLPELPAGEALPSFLLAASGGDVPPDTPMPVQIAQLAFSPDGRYLAAGCAGDGTVRFVDLGAR